MSTESGPAAPTDDEWSIYVIPGRQIAAVKAFRTRTGCGLKEAMDAFKVARPKVARKAARK